MLIIGVWMILQLHKYVETPDNSRVSTALPLTFMGLAASIMVLASLACCCTAKGKVPLLYLVSFLPTLVQKIHICPKIHKVKTYLS